MVSSSTCSAGSVGMSCVVVSLLFRALLCICCSRCSAWLSSLSSWLVRNLCGVFVVVWGACYSSLSFCCLLGVLDLCELSPCDCDLSGVCVGLLELLLSCSDCAMSALAASNSCCVVWFCLVALIGCLGWYVACCSIVGLAV